MLEIRLIYGHVRTSDDPGPSVRIAEDECRMAAENACRRSLSEWGIS